MENIKNNFLGYIVGIALIVGLVFMFTNSSGEKGSDVNKEVQTSSASALTATTGAFDFGTIMMQDGNVEHEFMVDNIGTEPVVINKVYTSCMCTQAAITDSSGEERGLFGMPGHGGSGKTDIVVAPGESILVNAIYDPAAHGPAGVGRADRTIYLETNSKTAPKVELQFTATVTR